MSHPSDWSDLDGTTPLSERELRMIRAIIVEHEREEWARRKIRVVLPWLVTAVGVVWGFVEWFGRYFTFKGGQ